MFITFGPFTCHIIITSYKRKHYIIGNILWMYTVKNRTMTHSTLLINIYTISTEIQKQDQRDPGLHRIFTRVPIKKSVCMCCVL